jgi:hypothetical protein
MILTNLTLGNVVVVDSTIVTANLIMNLDATNGISGSTWTDLSGNNNNATLYNGVSNTAIGYTYAASFNGSNQYAFPLNGFGTQLNQTSGTTYELWIRPATTANGTLIIEVDSTTIPPGGYRAAQMAVVSTHLNAGVYNTGYITGPVVNANTWYNFSLVYNGTDTTTSYINGNSVGTTSGAESTPGQDYLVLGYPDGVGSYLGGATGFYNGYVGAWRVYNRGLSSTEIQQNFNAVRGRYGI